MFHTFAPLVDGEEMQPDFISRNRLLGVVPNDSQRGHPDVSHDAEKGEEDKEDTQG